MDAYRVTCAERSGAFLAFAEPPYWMRIPSATAAPQFSLIQPRISAWVAWACEPKKQRCEEC